MPKSLVLTTLAAALALSACARREEPTARQLGRETYQAGEKIKKGAKEAAKEIRDAGKEFSQGWKEARREAPKRRDK